MLESEETCNFCKHWLNEPDSVPISSCTKGMILGACWFDRACNKWEPKYESQPIEELVKEAQEQIKSKEY